MTRKATDQVTTIGIDIGKNNFHLIGLDGAGRRCQTNLNGPAKGAGLRCSGRQLTPLGQGGRAILFEDIAAVEVAVLVEVVVD